MYAVEQLLELEQGAGEQAIAAAQLLELYRFALGRPDGVFLELGTDRGQATNVILEACRQNGGRLVSVDIRDCSDAASGREWRFVRCSSTDGDGILSEAPYLKEGIDLVYVDSKHTPEHVTAEMNLWMPYIKVGGRMYFDDVDAGPYARGRRKDSAAAEIANRNILAVVNAYFQKNIAHLRLDVKFGSTGLACIEKRVPLPGDHALALAQVPRERRTLLPYKVLKRLGLYRPYRHKPDSSDLLIR